MRDSMLAVVKTEARAGVELRTVAIPRVGEDDVLVQVHTGGICGTDLHIVDWDPWVAARVRAPRIIGHEFCGTVVAVGQRVCQSHVGTFVAGECHLSCGNCPLCRQGEAHLCKAMQLLGVDCDGAFAEYVSLPAANAWPLPSRISKDIAAIMDPFGNAVHTALSTDLTGRSVLILGCGPIGLCAILVARRMGAKWIAAVDVSPYRLQLASQVGAHRTLDSRTDGIVHAVLAETEGQGADVLLDFSGNTDGIRTGLASVRNGGFVGLLGLPSQPLELDLAREVIFKGLRIHGIFGRKLWETWRQATALLSADLDVRPIITHRVPLSKFDEGLDLIRSGVCGKVIVTINEEVNLPSNASTPGTTGQ